MKSMMRAHAHWGANPPDWIVALATACDETSQKKAGDAIGYCSGAVNQVLGKKYTADLTAIEEAVRGAFMGKDVVCPVLGILAANRCNEIQRRPFSATNPTRVQLYAACRDGCTHSRLEE